MNDFAVFDGDRFVTNALLTPEQAAELELHGMRVVRVDLAAEEWGVPAFRGRRSVASTGHFRRGWRRD